MARPAIPTLLVARMVATLQASYSKVDKIFGAEAASFIIDFHNFGYSLLALKPAEVSSFNDWARLGETHPIVQAMDLGFTT